MKVTLLVIFGVAILLVVGASSWSADSYSIVCTKCLASQRLVERRVCGLTYSTKTTEGESGQDYERIYGRPCSHVRHRSGFSRRTRTIIACGITDEGQRYQPRDRAIAMAFRAEMRHRDALLTQQTFSLIDRLAPPDEVPPCPGDEAVATQQATLLLLADYLGRAESVEDWRAILRSAETDFADRSGLAH